MLVGGVVAAVVLAACGGAGSGDATSDLQSATVKIAAEGTFVDPEYGEQTNVAGVGSGFILDEDGTVVTNNHVVAGAAILRVDVDGRDDPVNATVLGVSECSDLAVIDLDGDGYAYLDVRPESAEVEPGLDVLAAGFPWTEERTPEDVDYTLTRGIISSVNADGETAWASVDSVLEHDARIRGGNSGGPLVDEDARVVGVNYSGIESADQNFAIAYADAAPIVERLRAGEDVESLGINGRAISDPEAEISGIWVSSVTSGSPADLTGIEPGDLITSLENLDVGTDGTMEAYCDVLRTQGTDAVLKVEVLRLSTEEVLEGEINGEPLAVSFSFAQEFEADDTGGGDIYAEYMPVTDDTGAIEVYVPTEWSDLDGAPNPEFGPSIYAAPDLESFLDTWDTPGLILEVSGDYGAGDVEAVLDEFQPTGCSGTGREAYEDPLYTGLFEVWESCDGTDTGVITLAVTPEDGSFVIRLAMQIVEERDLDALDQVIDTFVADL
jgi:serine protease Do